MSIARRPRFPWTTSWCNVAGKARPTVLANALTIDALTMICLTAISTDPMTASCLPLSESTPAREALTGQIFVAITTTKAIEWTVRLLSNVACWPMKPLLALALWEGAAVFVERTGLNALAIGTALNHVTRASDLLAVFPPESRVADALPLDASATARTLERARFVVAPDPFPPFLAPTLFCSQIIACPMSVAHTRADIIFTGAPRCAWETRTKGKRLAILSLGLGALTSPRAYFPIGSEGTFTLVAVTPSVACITLALKVGALAMATA